MGETGPMVLLPTTGSDQVRLARICRFMTLFPALGRYCATELNRCAIFRSVPPGLGPSGVYNGWKGSANSVLSFFLLHYLGIFILFAYFILLELHCISNSFIFFPLSLIHLIFNPLLLHFPSHSGQEYIGRHVFPR